MNILNNTVTEETTIVTFDEWAKEMSDKYKNTYMDAYNGTRLSLEAAKFLEPLVAGYMTVPAVIYKGTSIVSKTVKVRDINEFKTE